MTITMATIRNAFAALVTGVAFIATGCTDATTREDVADAREELREEQADVTEAKDEAKEDIADAREDAQEHTVSKPVTDEAAEARQEIADAQHEASENIKEEQQDVQEATAELKTEEQRMQATQARDAYVKAVEGKLAEMQKSIDEMKEQASNAEGTDKDAIDLKIETLQAQHERTEEALDSLKDADLASWENHKAHVRTAMQDTGTVR